MKTETLPERLEVDDTWITNPRYRAMIAAELAHRYNVHRELVEALKAIIDEHKNSGSEAKDTGYSEGLFLKPSLHTLAIKALASAERKGGN